jgi:hypothetical protein
MITADITNNDVREITIKTDPRQIIINGRELDLSKVRAVRMDFDYTGLEVCVSTTKSEFPYRETDNT